MIGTVMGHRDMVLLRNIAEVRMYVDTYDPVMSGDRPFIGDLSLLKPEAVSVLLKFVEEEVSSILCYASEDDVSPVLMSRFDKIHKESHFSVREDSFQMFVQSMEEKESVKSVPKEFLSKSAGYLDTYLLYRRLGKGAIQRISRFL